LVTEEVSEIDASSSGTSEVTDKISPAVSVDDGKTVEDIDL